jgi:hypothetical protein
MLSPHLPHTQLIFPYLCSQATPDYCSCRPLASTHNLTVFLLFLQAEHTPRLLALLLAPTGTNTVATTMKCKGAVEGERCSDTSPRVSLGQNSQSTFRVFRSTLILAPSPFGTVSALMMV